MRDYPAHIRIGPEGVEIVQSVTAHCRKAAEYAATVLRAAGLAECGYLAGLLHDLGKLTKWFCDYITAIAQGLSPKRGSVNHTFAGVRFLLERYHSAAFGFRDIVCELLALAIGSHHGLFDCVNEQGESGFLHRLTKPDVGYEEAVSNYLSCCAGEAEIDERFCAAEAELVPRLRHICEDMVDETASDARYDEEVAFYTGLLARLLLSAVIEGDRRDTAEFMNNARFPAYRSNEEMKRVWATCLQRTEQHIARFPQKAAIDRARRKISDACRKAAALPGGVYRLNVPTGGGKTLSMLRFALAHASLYGKRRILYVSPLLSILEQNAAVIRDCIQDDSLILEHHSNLVQPGETQEELDLFELLTETWDAPIIITTLVQFLNTLFSAKTTCIRRFHALSECVILIDEVQTVPARMRSMFTLAVNFLTGVCGATVVLCSATQPCAERIEHPLHPATEIVPYDPALWAAFQRTSIRDLGSRSLAETADFARAELREADSLLIVCNKRDEVSELFRALADYGGKIFVLSAAMCTAHRRSVLQAIRESLETPGAKTLCIATQVIQAGVDISFQRVIRLASGMDDVVQAAGRCNRNGEAGEGVLALVYIAQCQGEKLSNLPDIQRGKDATLALLTEFALHPEQYRGALDSDEAIRDYYATLYRGMPAGYMDDPVRNKPYTLLSLNARNVWMECTTGESFCFRQAFRLAGSLFEVFAQDTTDVIVPHAEGAEIIVNLSGGRAEHDGAYLAELLEQAKPYTVSLYAHQFEALKKEGALHLTKSGVWTLDGHYDTTAGLTMEQTQPLQLLEG